MADEITAYDLDDALDLLEKYPVAMKMAIRDAGERLPDVIGVMHSNQAQIRDMKRIYASELEDGEAGSRWQVELAPKNDYSYNTQGILAAFLGEWEGTLAELLVFLIHRDVLRPDWQLTKLRNLATEMGVSLTTAGKEIEDGDNKAQIGKIKGKAYPKFLPVTEEEDGKQDT